MTFEKGNKHGKGRPKKPEIEQFRLAIAKVEKEHDRSLLEEFVHQAYKDRNVMIAAMKKVLPDMKFVDAKLDGDLGVIFQFKSNGTKKSDN